MRSVCVHEDKGLRGHRVPDLLTTTITIGLTNPLVALHVKLTLSSQSDLRHSVSPRSGARQVTETLTNSTAHLSNPELNPSSHGSFRSPLSTIIDGRTPRHRGWTPLFRSARTLARPRVSRVTYDAVLVGELVPLVLEETLSEHL